MKIKIEVDSWYPVYTTSDQPACYLEVDVPEETVARWKRATADFAAMQTEIETLLNAALSDARPKAPEIT